MNRVTILGSASAVPTIEHENTHILVQAGQRTVLVDCPGSPAVRLEQAQVSPQRLTDIFLTHFHPDHVSGFAPLLMGMWLVGRKDPIYIYGLDETIDRAVKMLELFHWDTWPNFYQVHFVRLPEDDYFLALNDPDLRVVTSPVDHLIPTLGLRFEFGIGGGTAAYSCDTEPSQAVRRLAQDVDVLIHEATGPSRGHTPPEKAGEIAAQAGAKSLYLIHYPPQLVTPEHLLARARQTYPGPVFVAEDLMKIDIS